MCLSMQHNWFKNSFHSNMLLILSKLKGKTVYSQTWKLYKCLFFIGKKQTSQWLHLKRAAKNCSCYGYWRAHWEKWNMTQKKFWGNHISFFCTPNKAWLSYWHENWFLYHPSELYTVSTRLRRFFQLMMV